MFVPFNKDQIFIKIFFFKMFAPFNKDQIWTAYPPYAVKENIKNISGGPLVKFKKVLLRFFYIVFAAMRRVC